MEDKRLAHEHIKRICSIARKLGHVTVMEVCGGHTNLIMKYGIRRLLPSNLRLISGPGCPVCVSSQSDIDCMIELANNGVPIATYGDMLRVPGSSGSLEQARASGAVVHEVYAATEVLGLREKHPDIVFFGVGFETTAPMTAFLLQNGVTVYSVHKLIPPALAVLAHSGISGFINPGHVSTVIGVAPYRGIRMPQVIAGFTPERLLRALSMLLELLLEGRKAVINGYPEAVREDGNRKAQRMLRKHFRVGDSEWRGLGILPQSGLEVTNVRLNAKKVYRDLLGHLPEPKDSECRCGDVLKGLIEPVECPLYRKSCSPESPQGACMVSEEGSCAIYYRHGN
jgi:hydrogenase expression/formation protein HypD